MSFETAMTVWLVGVPLIAALLFFGVPWYFRKMKEWDDRHRPTRFKSPRSGNHFKYRRR